MNSYRVEWVIDIDADTPEDAARQALAIQRDPESIATVFEVMLEDGEEPVRIDITELDDEAHSEWLTTSPFL